MKPSEYAKQVANQVVEECASTNDLARALGEAGYPHGTWISARKQGAGRGRLGRQWQSLEGNLFLSLLFRSPDKSRWSWVPLVTAVGIARALRKIDPALDVRIKWPNDLWIGKGAQGAKLGGILCEAVGNREGSFIVVGIGLNCAAAPEGLDQRTISLGGGNFAVEVVRPAVLAELGAAYAELLEHGPQLAARDFEELAALPRGTRIEWGANGLTGTVEKLGDSGELVVRASTGEMLKLYAEDVKVKVVR